MFLLLILTYHSPVFSVFIYRFGGFVVTRRRRPAFCRGVLSVVRRRVCCQVVCQACSTNKFYLEYLKNQPARVCDHCFTKLQENSKR